MIQSVRTAAAGMRAEQERLDNIASNIANVNTVAYKSVRTDFKDALYNSITDPVGGSEENNLTRGAGVIANGTNRNFSTGVDRETEGKLDFMLEGKGFFTLQDSGGQTLYTRNGNFSLSAENGNTYLVNGDGYYVMSDTGKRISLSTNDDITVDAGGTIFSNGARTANFAIAEFPNQTGLSDVGDSCFMETQASGGAARAEAPNVMQGSLESSNVDLAQEMTLMIRTQRAYTMASKALQTADDMDGLANNMRG